jgi:hypothetical protein
VTDRPGTIAGTPRVDDDHMQAFPSGDSDLR